MCIQVYVVSYGGGNEFRYAFEELRGLAIPEDLFLPNLDLALFKEYTIASQGAIKTT